MMATLSVIAGAVTVLYAVSALGRIVPVKRRHHNWRQVTGMSVATLLVLGIAACAYGMTTARRAAAPAATAVAGGSGMPIGVFAPGEWKSWSPVLNFSQETGQPVRYVLDYMGPDEVFPAQFGKLAAEHGAEPVLQLEPAMNMAAIAAGRDDAYLHGLAQQVDSYGRPVVLSFAPEANGNWYAWGWSHTPAAVWVAAWRHVVTAFRQAGAANVTWMWTINVPFPHSGPVSDYWPGDAYVGMVGVDGYFARPSDTFTSLFGPIVGQIRKLTAKPVLISETANGPDSGAEREAQIRDLFAGVKADHLLGLIWFDQSQHNGIYHQDWRLEDDPAALAAFRASVKEYR